MPNNECLRLLLFHHIIRILESGSLQQHQILKEVTSSFEKSASSVDCFIYVCKFPLLKNERMANTLLVRENGGRKQENVGV